MKHEWRLSDYRHLPRKGQIAYVLTTFLERNRTYSEGEIDAFIRNNTKAITRSDPHLDVDHLRLAMLESGFLKREPDCSEYRVAEDFSSPWDWNREPAREYHCPFCGYVCRGTQVPIHLSKYHDMDEIIERWLGA